MKGDRPLPFGPIHHQPFIVTVVVLLADVEPETGAVNRLKVGQPGTFLQISLVALREGVVTPAVEIFRTNVEGLEERFDAEILALGKAEVLHQKVVLTHTQPSHSGTLCHLVQDYV